MRWSLAELRSKLGNLIARPLTDGAQAIRRQRQVVVHPSEVNHLRPTGQNETLKDYLLTGPDLSGLDLTRDNISMREFEW